jgi:hypothetical protein
MKLDERVPTVLIMRGLMLSLVTLSIVAVFYSTSSQVETVKPLLVEPVNDTTTLTNAGLKILDSLGTVGRGKVYRAEYLGQEVTVKVLNDEHEGVDEFKAESKFLMILNGSSHIIPVLATIPTVKAIILPILLIDTTHRYGDLSGFIRDRSRDIRSRDLPVSVLLHIAIHLSIAVQQGISLSNPF